MSTENPYDDLIESAPDDPVLGTGSHKISVGGILNRATKDNVKWDDSIVDIGDRLVGETTDDNRMDRAIAAALTFNSFATIRLRANEQLVFNRTIEINAARYGIQGHMTFMVFLGLTEEMAVWIYADPDGNPTPPPTGTDPDYTSAYKMNNVALSGVVIVGSWSSSAGSLNTHKGLVLGHDTARYNAFFEVNEVAIQGFGQNGNIFFKNNSWRLQLDKIISRWGINIIPEGYNNFGENLNITRSMFEASSSDARSPGWKIGSGTANFLFCSFDNCNIEVSGDAVVWFNQCHFERPGSSVNSSYRLAIISSEASVTLDNCLIVPPGSSTVEFRDPFFFVADANTEMGLILNSCKWFNVDNFKPYWNAKNQVMVGGKGRVQVSGFLNWNTPTVEQHWVFSESLNALYNGDAELGTIDGWTKDAGTGTFLAVAAPAFSTPPVSGDQYFGKTFGNFSFQLVAAAGQTVTAYQEMAIKPGQTFLAQYWRKTLIGGTGEFTRDVKFYTKSGAEIPTRSRSSKRQLFVSSDWNVSYSQLQAVAPAGAASVRISFFAQGVGGTTTGYFDDVIVNIV